MKDEQVRIRVDNIEKEIRRLQIDLCRIPVIEVIYLILDHLNLRIDSELRLTSIKEKNKGGI